MGDGPNPYKLAGEWCETCNTTRAVEELTQLVARLQADLERAERRLADLERFLGQTRDTHA